MCSFGECWVRRLLKLQLSAHWLGCIPPCDLKALRLPFCAPHRFFTDAYDLFVIGVVKPMIAIVYYPALNGKARRRPFEPDVALHID